MKIIWNTTEDEHKHTLISLFKSAQMFECAVAFVKMSGFKSITKILEKRLKAGMLARFMVGLDFYLTDPEVLNELLRLSKKFSNLKSYVSNSDEQVCFHPKVYAFSYSDGKTKLLIGSANITAGGFGNNWECSFLCEQKDNKQLSGLLYTLIETRK
jgi:HKD family nuclease